MSGATRGRRKLPGTHEEIRTYVPRKREKEEAQGTVTNPEVGKRIQE